MRDKILSSFSLFLLRKTYVLSLLFYGQCQLAKGLCSAAVCSSRSTHRLKYVQKNEKFILINLPTGIMKKSMALLFCLAFILSFSALAQQEKSPFPIDVKEGTELPAFAKALFGNQRANIYLSSEGKEIVITNYTLGEYVIHPFQIQYQTKGGEVKDLPTNKAIQWVKNYLDKYPNRHALYQALMSQCAINVPPCTQSPQKWIDYLAKWGG